MTLVSRRTVDVGGRFGAISARSASDGLPTLGSVAKVAVKHACTECGTTSSRWLGRCPGCGEYNTLVEELPALAAVAERARPLLRLVDVQADEADRIPTGVDELDRVLGGGLVPASLVLVGGEPGVGKSTLLLTALREISGARGALLITGEESAAQVKLRAERLGGAGNVADPRRDGARDRLRDARARAARGLRDRLRPDALLVGDRLGARLGGAGQGGGIAPAPGRQGGGRGDVPRRPRDEGRRRRRPARARAPGRLRAPVRGRPLPRAPHPPRRQEPLRLDERARRLRDDRRRPRRRPRPVGALRQDRAGRGRRSRRLRARGDAADPARGAVARRADRPRDAPSRRHGRRSEAPGDDRRGALAARGIPLGSADVFVNVAGGVRIDEPGADLAIALAIASAARGVAGARTATPSSARSG